MTKVTYPNGHISQYDETIKVGDIISTYHSGFHRVTEVKPREGGTPLISYVKIAKDDGSKSKAIPNRCDASFCKHALGVICSLIVTHEKAIKGLQEFVVSYKL